MSASSKKTYLNTLLGALAREEETMKTTSRHTFLKKKSMVARQQSAYNKKQKGSTKKATPMTLRDADEVSKETAIRGFFVVSILCCGRAANMIHPANRFYMQRGRLVVELNHHKTLTHIGPKTFNVQIPKSVLPLVTRVVQNGRRMNVFKEIHMTKIKKILLGTKWGLHSMRRGGAARLVQEKIPFERIRQVTQHTTDLALLRYVDRLDLTGKETA